MQKSEFCSVSLQRIFEKDFLTPVLNYVPITRKLETKTALISPRLSIVES